MFIVLSLTMTVVAQKSLNGGTKAITETLAMSSTKTVKGSPFSADGISESVEFLADGNKITRNVTHKLYRDGEGRFRREEISASGANSLTLFGAQQAIFIFDPVAGARLILDPAAKTAHRVESSGKNGVVAVTSQPLTAAKRMEGEASLAGQNRAALPPLVATGIGMDKTESLGVREFEGISAEGTRTVMTIAAGKIGNERPIETVYERWYSKELQLIVYSKHTDPRSGEQTYRLTNINRSEPDRSLFTLPADYKNITEPGGAVVMKKQQ
jgi:hypothetical protein